jgi:GNAT superfamily N-acetyltransferase
MVGPQTSQNALCSPSPLAYGRPLQGDSTRRFAQEGVQFCPRRSDHAAGLFALFNERQFLERASTRGPLADEHEVNRWLDGIIVARKFEIVAVSNSNLIAFGGLYVHGDLFDHCGTLMLGVRENAQGRGVGSTLMAILLATAKMRANLRRVQLTVFAGNARHSPLSEIWLRIRGFAPVLFTTRNRLRRRLLDGGDSRRGAATRRRGVGRRGRERHESGLTPSPRPRPRQAPNEGPLRIA